ncbi:cysteine-rich receptor-like protein kinase 10 [Olea europaea var. sylvestris]|uniref:cysteine-rich receptor-like protein kinase 10 n=1 Tax=Olea europaea var. sylvestris TaxID=158386 RepID=UPI000C1D42F9|nr:cysteine-rich receptor-like protein kinase 10 [Olea europaea var. sylvestris]
MERGLWTNYKNENILIYEYTPNKSLDCFLSNPDKRELLSWTTHECYKRSDSKTSVSPRIFKVEGDTSHLKAYNILLDHNLNPKISDFGLAIIFGYNNLKQKPIKSSEHSKLTILVNNQANVKQFTGITGSIFVYHIDGYMSPNPSGEKNYSSCPSERQLNLISHAWELWKEGRVVELMDSRLDNPSPKEEIMRRISVLDVALKMATNTTSFGVAREPIRVQGQNEPSHENHERFREDIV